MRVVGNSFHNWRPFKTQKKIFLFRWLKWILDEISESFPVYKHMHISLYFTVSKRKTRKNNGVKKCTSGQTKAYGILERGVSQRRLLRSQYSPDQNLQGLPIIFEIKYKHLVIIYKTLPYRPWQYLQPYTLSLSPPPNPNPAPKWSTGASYAFSQFLEQNKLISTSVW